MTLEQTTMNDQPQPTPRGAWDHQPTRWWPLFQRLGPEDRAHARRVADSATILGCAIGLRAEGLRRLQHGALLHDIGKLSVPQSILDKPGPLNDGERQIIERHPNFALPFLSESQLTDLVDVPYCHHERWDGTGYPRRLAGEAIPLDARIVGLVDIVDALASERPYRPRWSGPSIRSFIAENAGAHLDPHLAKLFLDLSSPDARLFAMEPDGAQ